MSPASIYVHIPFCRRKCAYCDFASYPSRQGDMSFYVEKLLWEMRAAREKYGGFSVPSIFVGGGTPSILPAEDIARILREISALFRVEEDAEITLEANPGTLTREWLIAAKQAGANRLSLGAQAFQDEILREIGRIHTAAEIGEAVALARECGFENISVDLMYGLPGQTMEHFCASLEAALGLGVRHVSCYSLILEEGTPLTRRVEQGEVSVPGDEETLAMQRMAAGILRRGGILQYEISNYAHPGFESRHNIGYWRRGDYLGLGCAAHSLMRGERFCNDASLDGYFAGKIGIEREKLTREDEIEEAVMLETRTAQGIDIAAFYARYGIDFDEKYGKKARALAKSGLALYADDRFALTPDGFDVHNAVVLELLA